MSIEDNIGARFGRLVITGVGTAGYRTGNTKYPRKYECVCDCGKALESTIGRLRSGNTKSCGCITRTAGGLGNTPEYKVWKEMHRRCKSPNHKRFMLWGGRGVAVCPEWDDFSTFMSDMGGRPSNKHSIERRDNNGGYSKANCCWATPEEQANNKSSNRLLTFNGKTQSMALWCRELRLNYNTVRSRVYILGWSTSAALTT